jgi:hypothetical protein
MSAFLLNDTNGTMPYSQQFIATTIAHEIGHTLSLVHLTGGNPYNIQAGSAPFDVMAYNYSSNPTSGNNAFSVSLDALLIGLNQDVTGHVTNALNYYTTSKNTGGQSGAGVNGDVSSPDSDPVPPVAGKFLTVTDATTGSLVSSIDFGGTALGSTPTKTFTVRNYGTDTVTLQLPVLSGSSDFTLVIPNNFTGALASEAVSKPSGRT